MPHYLSIGVSRREILHSTPKVLKEYDLAYDLTRKRRDEEMWFMGQYVYSAVATAVEHNLAGKKAKSEYLKKPVMQLAEDKRFEQMNTRKEYVGMTAEQQEQAELEKAKTYFNSLMKRF